MPKFVLTIETNTITELAAVMAALINTEAGASTSLTATVGKGAEFPDDTGDDPALALPKRGRPKKAAPVSPPPGSNGADAQSPTHAAFQAAVEATDPAKETLPSLESLKHVVTTAVRLAQKGEGDPKILTHLPAFKTKTGLDFVMNATEDHRAALFELVGQAGLTLA